MIIEKQKHGRTKYWYFLFKSCTVSFGYDTGRYGIGVAYEPHGAIGMDILNLSIYIDWMEK